MWHRTRPRSVRASRWLFAACLIPFALSAAAEIPSRAEIGLPFFDVFEPRDYHGHGQVWSAAEDAAGLVYFGNLGRVLIYDGARWSHLPVPGTTYIRGLAVDADDTLWIGAVDELGYAKTDATGERRFVSLKDRLPPEARACGEIWRIALTPRGPLFQTNGWLLRWDGHAFVTLPLPFPGSWQMVRVGDALWVNQAKHGWSVVVDDGTRLSLQSGPQSQDLVGRAFTFSVPGPVPGETLLGTPRVGVLRWNGERFAPFPTVVDDALRKGILYGGTRLPDGRLLLSTLQAGAFLLDDHGRLLAQLDEGAGLPDNTVPNVFTARSGTTWLCLEHGLVRVDARPWLTWFSAANGLPRGQIDAPVRFRDALYSATSTGLLRLQPAAGAAPARFTPVSEFTDFLNHAIVADDVLIGLGVQGLFRWQPGAAPRPLPGKASNAFGFTESKTQPGRWFALADNTVVTFHRDGDAWIEEGPIPGLENVRDLYEEADGSWWLGTSHRGALRVTFPDANPAGPGRPVLETFGRDQGLPAHFGWVRLLPVHGRPLLQCEQGFFRFDAAQNRFEPTAEFGPRFADGSWTARSLAPDPHGGLWLAAKRAGEAEIVGPIELGLADATGWHALPLPTVPWLEEINSLELEPSADVLWIAGHGGLVRVDLAGWRASLTPAVPALQLRRVTDRAGTRLPLAGDWSLPFDRRTLTVEFAAAGTVVPAGVVYESTLFGAGRPLIQTDAEPHRDFAGLGPGPYRLRLRARDASGAWSRPVELAFAVLPPWWLGGWAWSAYVALGGAAVGGVIAQRTRALRRRAHALEATVAERTEQLRRSNTELARLHQLELDEKIAARLGEEKARLEVLRYQLNPHFLFNAFATLHGLITEAPAAAGALTLRLSEFCRQAFARDAEVGPVRDELAMLRSYLDAEHARWGDTLRVSIDAGPAALDRSIPPFLLLPLVENAIKYGGHTSPDLLELRLAVHPHGDAGLAIEVANTGHWLERDAAAARRTAAPAPVSTGLGLENIRRRLARHYAGTHALTIGSADGWVRVRLTLSSAPHEPAAPPSRADR